MDTANAINGSAWTFVLIFLLCEFGGMVTDRFERFYDDLCQCEWNLLPMDMQRIYLMFVLNAQQPAMIRGFASIVCTRVFFSKVKFLILQHLI